MTRFVKFKIKDIAKICKTRQLNELDAIIVISGSRGVGKSTCAWKIGKSKYFKKVFRPTRDILYSRNDIMHMMEKTKNGFFIDDESIRSAYKRNFQETDQKVWVQMLNMYRNNFNVVCLCIPQFFSLDKDLRNLCKIHIHVIERGKAVVHVAREDVLYSDDPWDIAYNKKIEESWAKKMKANPKFKPRYNRLTTFVGFLEFKKLSEKAKKQYEDIKEKKRKKVYDEEMSQEGGNKVLRHNTSAYDTLYKNLIEGKLTRQKLEDYCNLSGLKVTTVFTALSNRIRDNGVKDKLTVLLLKNKEALENKDGIPKDAHRIPLPPA